MVHLPFMKSKQSTVITKLQNVIIIVRHLTDKLINIGYSKYSNQTRENDKHIQIAQLQKKKKTEKKLS